MKAQASLDIDRNHKSVQSNEAFLTRKTVSFTGAADLGAVGTINLFTVTGDVITKTCATCSEDLVSAGGGTISVGVSGNTATILAVTTATDLDTGEGWVDSSPGTGELLADQNKLLVAGADIIATVATADITDGTLTFYCMWRPLSTNGNVVAA